MPMGNIFRETWDVAVLFILLLGWALGQLLGWW